MEERERGRGGWIIADAIIDEASAPHVNEKGSDGIEELRPGEAQAVV